jgi:hypothetical protein
VSILQPVAVSRTGKMQRLTIGFNIHRSGTIGDLFWIGKVTEFGFLLLRDAPQDDVLSVEPQQLVSGDALTLTKVDNSHTNRSHARYYKTQSHIDPFGPAS